MSSPYVALVAEPRGRLQLQPLLDDPAGEELADGDLCVLDHAAVAAADHLVQRCGGLPAGGEPVLAHLATLAVITVVYSADPEHYVPLCRSCHRTVDARIMDGQSQPRTRGAA
jgi:hypothetical protein